MNLQYLDDGFPSALEGANALLELLVLTIAGVGGGPLLFGVPKSGQAHAGAQSAVLALELSDALFEGDELGFTPVTAVLRCDPITVCAGLLALVGGEFCTGAFAGRAIAGRVWSGLCRRG